MNFLSDSQYKVVTACHLLEN